MLIIHKFKEIKFEQKEYDSFFFCIENNLREMGFGDVSVNKKMKDFNKIFYDILLKINMSKNEIKINKELVLKYFSEFEVVKNDDYQLFDQYFVDFYHFCFELDPKTMIKKAIKFKV